MSLKELLCRIIEINKQIEEAQKELRDLMARLIYEVSQKKEDYDQF